MNIHANRKGRPATLTGTGRTRRLAATFPGWGDPDYAAHFIDTADTGLEGTVTAVNSHGSAPYTRYNVTFTDGSRMIDAVDGKDITVA